MKENQLLFSSQEFERPDSTILFDSSDDESDYEFDISQSLKTISLGTEKDSADFFVLLIHEVANIFLRTSEVNKKYQELKEKSFSIKKSELDDFLRIFDGKFKPLYKDHYNIDQLNNEELQKLFHFIFNPNTPSPKTIISENNDISLRKIFLDKLKIDKELNTALKELDKNIYKTPLETKSDDSSSFLASSLMLSRNFKNITKAVKTTKNLNNIGVASIHILSNTDPLLGTSTTDTTIRSQSSNTQSKIHRITTYKKLLNKLPTNKDSITLLTKTCLKLIQGTKIEEIKNSTIPEKQLTYIQTLSRDLVDLFFLENARNPSCTIMFPMWLELMEANSTKYKNSFPMAMKKAVAFTRGFHKEFSNILSKPFIIDFDSNNVQDPSPLIKAEFNLISAWCKEFLNIDLQGLLQEYTNLEKQKQSNSNEIISRKIQSALKTLKTRSSNTKKKEKNAINGENIKKKELELNKQRKEFITKILNKIEKKLSEWYNIELPMESVMTEQEYPISLDNDNSPFKKKPKVTDKENAEPNQNNVIGFNLNNLSDNDLSDDDCKTIGETPSLSDEM